MAAWLNRYLPHRWPGFDPHLDPEISILILFVSFVIFLVMHKMIFPSQITIPMPTQMSTLEFLWNYRFNSIVLKIRYNISVQSNALTPLLPMCMLGSPFHVEKATSGDEMLDIWSVLANFVQCNYKFSYARMLKHCRVWISLNVKDNSIWPS